MVKSVLILLLLSVVATQALQSEEGYGTSKEANPEEIPEGAYQDEYYDDEVGSGDYEGYENYYGDDMYDNGKDNGYYDGLPANSDDEDNYDGSGELSSGDDENYDDDEIVPEGDDSEATTTQATTTEKDVTTSTPAVETKSSTSIIPNEEEGEIDVPTTSAPKAKETPKRKHPHHKKNKEIPEKKEEVKLDVEIIEQQGTSFSLSDGHFLTAAIIGGCIGFLFAVALIMLLLYRMRKKDEGSFSLQDGKKKGGPPGYQYAQGQEYYA